MTNKRTVAQAVVAIFFLSAFANAQEVHKELSAGEKQHVLGGPFIVKTKTEDIPALVKQAFAKTTRESSFSLANPGEKFQIDDYVVDQTLPWRRLIFAGTRGDEWFVHYERGGYAHSYYVLVFNVDSKNELRFICGLGVVRAAKNLDDLRRLMADGVCTGDKRNYW